MINNQVYLNKLRHSCAHLLAAAVMELWPHAKRAIGPAIENGFYYDFDFGDNPISQADFPKIEAKMREILKNWKKFERHELDSIQAKKEYPDNPYKQELIDEFSQNGKHDVSFYKSGNYWDLCRGGHIEHPDKELKYFQLLSIAGAYWRGDEKNPMLTRIYGTCWPSKEELDKYVKQLEEAKKRDHRRLGKELDLFSISPLTGPGLILWHPKLAVVRNELEDMWRKQHYQRGYQLVFTPHIASTDMFVISRHLSKYVDYMFPIMLHEYIEGESAPDYAMDEVLKPMNCPNHIQIYKSRPRSYRELPLRLGELGTVYRYERAGVLHGMTRVRGFTQDDSHIFCTPDQVITEVRGVLQIMKDFYQIFGFTDYQAYISTRPEKYLGSLQMWEFAENSLKTAAREEGLDFQIDAGAGVFYGPKIDMKVKDSIGREWQLGTVQFDFNQPAKVATTNQEIEEFWQLKTFKKIFKTKANLTKYLKKLGRGFNITYIDKDGRQKQCVMIHRVIYGSLERFVGILIEHYAGKFPLWLSPVQVTIVPLADRHQEAAHKFLSQLKLASVRAEIDQRSESISKKIRDAQLQKVPYIAIMGDKEISASPTQISVRNRQGEVANFSQAEFISKLIKEIETKV